MTTVGGDGDAPTVAVRLDVLLPLGQELRDRVTVRFDYVTLEGNDVEPGPPRRVEPHHLAASQDRWYQLAWDLGRENWRLFSARRVRPRVPAGAPFVSRVVPGGDVDAFV